MRNTWATRVAVLVALVATSFGTLGAGAAHADPAGDLLGTGGLGGVPGVGPMVNQLRASGLASTVALDNCSGSLVRYPTSSGSDRAMVLTNGHCYEGGFIDAGVVLVDQPSSRTGTLLDDRGRSLGTLRADRVLYATMTGTDVTLYRLTDTYDAIAARTGTRALTISASRPADGSTVAIPSSYWKTTYSCAVDGFVDTLREGEWTWHDSIRYRFPDDGCRTIHGTSGSPIVDTATHEVVGINNTGNDDGGVCSVDNPCEDTGDGTPDAVQGQNYGQQTYWFTTCLAADNSLDLARTGCLLPRP